MGRKKLNIAGVKNELEASAFFSPMPAKTAQAAPAPATERTAEANNETTKHRLNERTVERTKVRHTFDVFSDQVTALKRIQLEREETSEKRYRMGDLVQEALDSFITAQRNRD
jgi:hypothetical protein